MIIPFTVGCQHIGSEGHSCPWCRYFESSCTLVDLSLPPVTLLVSAVCAGALSTTRPFLGMRSVSAAWLLRMQIERGRI